MEFVYDRTRSDVDRVIELNRKYLSRTITEEEKEEWKGNLKGALNASDLNRVEENTLNIASFLGVLVTTKSWLPNDISRVSDYQRIRDNVEFVRNAWYDLPDTPVTPQNPLNTYQKWNDIERILHDINYTYQKTIENYNYCGEIYAGEGIGVL